MGDISEQLLCSSCSRPLALICQLYCPLDGSDLHRVVLILICCDSQCHRWNVFRFHYPVDKNPLIKSTSTSSARQFVTSSWCDDANDWGDGADEANEMEKPLEEKSMPVVGSTFEEDKELIGCIPMFPSGFIDAVTTDQPDDSDDSDTELVDDVNEVDGRVWNNTGNNDQAFVQEEYEKPNVSFDIVTLKFMNAIADDPDQILRYEFGGKPLYYSHFDVNNVPNCEYCGGRRRFEFQLLPKLQQCLSTPNVPFSLDFTTILVFTCAQDCGASYIPRREFCVMQKFFDLMN